MIMGSLGYKSLCIIYLLKNCVQEECFLLRCCFPSGVILELGIFVSSVSPGWNKSIPDFLPLVSLLHWEPPWNWYSCTGSQKTITICHSMVPPIHTRTCTRTHTLLSPRLAGLLHFPLPVMGPGKPVYTTEMPRDRKAEPARAGSSAPSTLFPQTSVPGHVWTTHQPRHVTVSVKDAIDKYNTPRIPG